MKLAILIPTTPDRQPLLERLVKELDRQIGDQDVKVIINESPLATDGGGTTGAKRNELIQSAIELNAECFAFFDSDDMPGPTYIKRGLEFVDSGLDCAELWGQIYFSGKKGNPFHHSIIHNHWYQDRRYYYRNPNHLNFLRTEKVKGIKYKDITIGEDGQYSISLQQSGVLQTEYKIPEIIYHYYAR